jgi:hypothetical protein
MSKKKTWESPAGVTSIRKKWQTEFTPHNIPIRTSGTAFRMPRPAKRPLSLDYAKLERSMLLQSGIGPEELKHRSYGGSTPDAPIEETE